MKIRHPLTHHRGSERGSVLVVCMVLAALGTIGVAAWFSLLDARSQQVEASLKAVERRVAVRNGRALAQRAIYTSFLHANNGISANITYTLADGKGSATLRENGITALRNDTAGLHAHDGATPLRSASTSVVVDVANGSGQTRWTYRLRNQHPALGGDLLSLHAPVVPTDTAPLVSGNLRVKGRAVLWDAIVRDLNSGLRADEYLLPNGIAGTTTFTNVAGGTVLPLNYPHYLRTTGVVSTTGVAGTAAAYRGELELFDNTVNPQNAYLERLGPSPVSLEGTTAAAISNGPNTIAPTPDDATLMAYIAANSPADVASTLSGYPALSSTVLASATAKIPALNNSQLFSVFNAQSTPPNDALASMAAAIDESTLTPALDQAILDFQDSKGTDFTVNGKGTLSVFLDEPGVERIVAINVKRLRLVGQKDATAAGAASSLPPLLLVVANRAGTDLSQIDLIHRNSRPLILVLVSTSPVVSNTVLSGATAFPDWRCILDLQNTGLAFNVSSVSGARIIGGIRGNHRITVTGGNVTLERDIDGTVLAPLLSRDAWIETVRN